MADRLININIKYFWIEAFKDCEKESINRIIIHRIRSDNNIITDSLGGYDWMDNPIFLYRRIIHIHGNHDL